MIGFLLGVVVTLVAVATLAREKRAAFDAIVSKLRA